ncbi:MAG: lytic transglycosylase domain-containing protein [Pseudoxanthomonas sp.]
MRGISPLLGSLLACVVLPASAGTLYKCESADGVPAYVSKRIAGARCQVVSSYVPDRRPARPPVVPAPAAAVTPTATSLATSAGTTGPVPAAAATKPVVATPTPAPASAAPRRVSGQVYSYIQDGVRHYTSTRPAGVQVASLRTIKYSYIETCYACANPGVNFGSIRLNTAAFQAEIASAAREFGVEESVVRAIIHAESAYRPNAVSRVGAQGLMQLMPATASRFGVSDAFDPGQNIRGGVQYLSWLLKRYRGDLTLAAAGYNAGEGAVDRHGGVPPYKETQMYVQRVAQLAARYRGTAGGSH